MSEVNKHFQIKDRIKNFSDLLFRKLTTFGQNKGKQVGLLSVGKQCFVSAGHNLLSYLRLGVLPKYQIYVLFGSTKLRTFGRKQ